MFTHFSIVNLGIIKKRYYIDPILTNHDPHILNGHAYISLPLIIRKRILLHRYKWTIDAVHYVNSIFPFLCEDLFICRYCNIVLATLGFRLVFTWSFLYLLILMLTRGPFFSSGSVFSTFNRSILFYLVLPCCDNLFISNFLFFYSA